MSVHVFCPLSGLCYYYWVWDINLLLDMCFANIFTQICSLSFHRCFLTQESFKFWCHLHYQVLYLCIIILVSSLRILCLLLDSKDIFLYFFSPMSFISLHSNLWAILTWFLYKMWGSGLRFRFFDLGSLIALEPLLKSPHPLNCFCTFAKKKKKISWQNTIPSYEYIVFINLFITQWTFELLLHFGYYQ